MTSTNEIKVGDKIRITALFGSDASFGIAVGDIMEVTALWGRTCKDVLAKYADGSKTLEYGPRLLFGGQYEKVAEDGIKVGDKIRITKRMAGDPTCCSVGSIHAVTHVVNATTCGQNDIAISVPGCTRYAMLGDQYEKVVEETPKRLTKADLKVGMKVVGHGRHDGKKIDGFVGTVAEVDKREIRECVLVDFGAGFSGHRGGCRGVLLSTETGFYVPPEVLSRAPEEAPKAEAKLSFKVGDKVVGIGSVTGERIEGLKGIVERVHVTYEGIQSYTVKFDGFKYGAWSVYRENIKAAPSEPAQKSFDGYIVVLFEGGKLRAANTPFVHPGYAAAKAEALRLTRLHKKQFVVFQSVVTTGSVEKEVVSKSTEAVLL